ncbi:MAG: InlB B-repeat-containing protein [Oscillospiraceae bacterium]|nr:InlB B-repeat-containing protein [Oscillospiraceae bacterium]MDD4414409.1 InlB B-repeat-containing protein [Oscillospiraceae bacterium]
MATKQCTKKLFRATLALAMCLILAAPLFVAPVSVSAFTGGSYTEVDYSTPMALNTTVTGSVDGEDEYIDTEYWFFYLDSGYTINLTAGKSYMFSYTLNTKNKEQEDMEPAIAVLTGGEFAGYGADYNGDCLAHAESDFYDPTAKIMTYFAPETTGEYRVLAGCYLFDGSQDIGVDTKLTIIEIGTSFKWEADLVGEDVGESMYTAAYYTASAQDGTIYTITNTDPDEWDPSNHCSGVYTLSAFSSDGENLWNYDLTLPSYSQPLVGADGTIYAATISKDTSSQEGLFCSSRIVALNPDGSEKWVKEYEVECKHKDDWIYFGFCGQMALSKDGILILNFYELTILAVDVNDGGEILWEIGDKGETLYFPSYNTWSSPVIYQDIVYIPLKYCINIENNYEYFYGVAAYQLSDGQELWHVWVDNCCGAADCNISVDIDGTIYLVGDGGAQIGDDWLNCPVYSISSDGVVNWVMDLDMYDENSFQTAINGDYLYVSSESSIYTLDKSTGELLGEIDVFGDCIYSLTALSDGSFLVLSFDYEDEYVYYYSRVSPDGNVTEWYSLTASQWGHYDGEEPLGTVTKDGYYVIATGEKMYCFDLEATLAAGWAQNSGNSAYTNSMESHSIAFVSNGGSDITSQTVWTGYNIEKPVDPTREDQVISETTTRAFTFDKWYTDEECTKPYDFSLAVMADVTLYAGWSHTDTVEDSKPEPNLDGSDADSGKSGSDADKSGTVSPPTGECDNLILWSMFGTISLAVLSGTKVSRRTKKPI